MVDFEKDEFRYCIHLGDLQLSFYFEDWKEALTDAKACIMTIEDFVDEYPNTSSEFYLGQAWHMRWSIDLSFDDDYDIHLKVTTPCIDYRHDNMDLKWLLKIKQFLEEFIEESFV